MRENPYNNGITDGSLVEDFDRETSSEYLSPSYKLGYRDGYNKGISDGNINDGTFAQKVKEAYENGLNDAWECATKILEMPYDDVKKVFPDSSHINTLIDISASDAIGRVKEYEKDIKAGDEVIVQDDIIGVATGIDKSKHEVYVVTKDGWSDRFGTICVRKTGRHYYEVEQLLNRMRG